MTQAFSNTTEQRLVHHERSWEQFKLIQRGFEDSPGVRLFYYTGIVEILMPGRDHNFFRKIIAFLLEIFFVAKGIEFDPTGSMAQEIEGKVFSLPKQMSPIALEPTFRTFNWPKGINLSANTAGNTADRQNREIEGFDGDRQGD